MNEKKLSVYMDQLNKEELPKAHRNYGRAEGTEDLMETVRRVKSLKEPVMPESEFEDRLIAGLSDNGSNRGNNISRVGAGRRRNLSRGLRRTLITVTAAAAAAIILFTVPNLPFDRDQVSIVRAMEQAMEDVKAYHGILEVVETNGLGETMTQSRREVWADSQGNYRLTELEGYRKGMVTVNNGQLRWQLTPEEEAVYLFPAFPDPYRFTFELGNEVEDVKNALSVEKAGEETIAGRRAVILLVTPEGGDSYRLWVDKETDLPLQRQSAMQNALQIKVTYTEIEFVKTLPEEMLQYSLPEGYTEINTNPEQALASLEEAKELAGFLPVIPEAITEGFEFFGISHLPNSGALKLSYREKGTNRSVIILESKPEAELKADSMALLGAVNGKLAEILSGYQGQADTCSVRWQENGLEYRVFGNIPAGELAAFVEAVSEGGLILPVKEDAVTAKPQVEVPYDLEAEGNDQKSVDAGHSPWRLDPAFVAQVFVNLQISPEGITGDYTIPYEAVTIVSNNGAEAVAKIESGDALAGYVYLKRLVRQDESGIWTVVGYDPAER